MNVNKEIKAELKMFFSSIFKKEKRFILEEIINSMVVIKNEYSFSVTRDNVCVEISWLNNTTHTDTSYLCDIKYFKVTTDGVEKINYSTDKINVPKNNLAKNHVQFIIEKGLQKLVKKYEKYNLKKE